MDMEPAAGPHAANDRLRQRGAQRRDQQHEAQRVGQKTRRQQQCAGHQNAQAGDHFVDRHLVAIHGGTGALHGLQSLLADQPGTDDRCREDRDDRPYGADRAADFDKKGDFRNRNGDEEKKDQERHLALSRVTAYI